MSKTTFSRGLASLSRRRASQVRRRTRRGLLECLEPRLCLSTGFDYGRVESGWFSAEAPLGTEDSVAGVSGPATSVAGTAGTHQEATLRVSTMGRPAHGG